MSEGGHRQKLYDERVRLMSTDRARHNILPLSKFGLMQITRQRVRPALRVETAEKCPTCMGTGKARPAILLTDDIKERLDSIIKQMGVRQVTLQVNPYVAAYLRRGFISQWCKCRWHSGRGLHL